VPGGEVVDGPPRRELGQLAGRSRVGIDGFSRNDAGTDRVLASWLVRAPAGTEVTVTARHPRAGVARASLRLDA
jgi:hypothetical protein